ncbi:MAG: saccharopine dehydrogenase family protein, partial [Longimicrobiales bacterium]
MTGVLCGLPYYLNLEAATLAVQAGAHFTDLGGNTAIVDQQRALDAEARGKGISVTPDTGLAPGMVNIFAQAGVEALDSAESIRMWVGGLPQDPQPPLNYQIVYSLEGVLDYYVTPAVILREGNPTTVEALSGLEIVAFDEPLGQLEAFFTGGGNSSLPQRYDGQIDTVEYKTLRYPGHADLMRAMRDLGLLKENEVDFEGHKISPRKFFIEQITPILTNPDGNDLVVARVEVAGTKGDAPAKIRYDVLDYFDPSTGLTAMMRTTGFSLSVTGLLQARGQVSRPGVGTPDEVVPATQFIHELRARGIEITRSDL